MHEDLLTNPRQLDEKNVTRLRDIYRLEAGLPSKGLWSLSHRNKARRISQVEMEPDTSKLNLFDSRKGLV